MKRDSSYGQVIHLPKRKAVSQHTLHAPALPCLTDMLSVTATDPAATGFLLSLLRDACGPVLWVQDHMSRRENGHLYTSALTGFGLTQPVLQVHVSHPRDVLWAMEEGAACAGLSAVVGEIHGAPAVLDFTATKRLALRADVSGVPVILLRSGDPGVLSAARERWRVTSLPSKTHPHDLRSSGTPQWDVNLFRARGRTTGRWVAQYDPANTSAADCLNLVPRADTGAVDAGDQSIPDSAEV